MPESIEWEGRRYRLIKFFKHDFFAATALYEVIDRSDKNVAMTPQKVVLKIGRLGDFLGLPLGWLGEWLCEHEMSILKRLAPLRGIPHLLGKFHRTALLYEYIEGQSLAEQSDLSTDFFDNLGSLLTDIHSRRVAYMDMNKRGNVLRGEDGLPYMVDFQISLHLPERCLGSRRLTESLWRTLQDEDCYHLIKHKRHLQRDLMTDEQWTRFRQKSGWITLHRKIFRPITILRRRMLNYLFHKGRLITDDISENNPESDPDRWKR